MRWLRYSGIALLAGVAMTASAREYVVSPNGDDGADGSRETPFRTISRAAAAMVPGDVCLVRAGTYRETVRPARSGEPDKPIVFRAWPGERPLVVGSDPVTGWERVKGDIWRAPMDWQAKHGDQIFIDGEPGHEARWPNKANNDPLDWEGADYDSGSTPEFLLCKALPSRPDGYWNGAMLWVLAGAKWTSWSTPVTDYVDAERKLVFQLSAQQGFARSHMSPADRRGGFFYLVGKREEIDRPGEWVVDAGEKRLYLQMEPGVDPNTRSIEAKRRELAFDFGKLDHLVLEGFAVRGASLSLADSRHCLIRDLDARWITHFRGGNTGYSLGAELGIQIGGEYNTIRDSVVAYSAGNGIKLGGRRNAVINCWIHDTDYTGCYDAPIKTWGEEMLISHNTIHDTGRDCIQPSGQAHIIQYNRIFHMGRLAHDLGATYVCGSDGGGTEFRYNWVHDNLAKGTRMGIYMDNFTTNYFAFRNVVWNIRGCDIRLNKPSQYCYVVNNTMLGNTGNWGRWPTDWMYNSIYANNAVGGTISPHPQAVFANNTFNIPAETLNPETFMTYPAGAGQGIAIPGLAGENPGIGAYEPGDTWRAGHDFANPPEVEYQLTDTPLRNLVAHGSFDWVRYRGNLGPWEATGAKTAKIIWGPGGISQSYTTRDTIISAGVQLSGETEDGIAQTIASLRPNQQYELSAWVKLKDGAKASLELPEFSARAEAKASDEWQMLNVRFTTGAASVPGTVVITKTGGGTAFVDDVGLVGVAAGLEPQLPGFAVLPPKEAPKPVLPRRTEPLLVPRMTQPGVYPGQPVPVAETPGRTRAEGPVCQAWLAHRDGILHIKIEIPLGQPVQIEENPAWTKSDGAEVCFSYPDENAQHPVFVLHGFPNGSSASSPEAGAPPAAAETLGKRVTYTATRSEQGWTAEWAIPLEAADIPGIAGLELDFNLGIFRRPTRQWIQWAGTQSQTWRVKSAGRIRLAE